VTARGDRGQEIVGQVGDFAPIEMEAVETADQRLLFRATPPGSAGTTPRGSGTCNAW